MHHVTHKDKNKVNIELYSSQNCDNIYIYILESHISENSTNHTISRRPWYNHPEIQVYLNCLKFYPIKLITS